MGRRSPAGGSPTSLDASLNRDHVEGVEPRSDSIASASSANNGLNSDAEQHEQQERVTKVLRACKDQNIASLSALAASGGGFAADEARKAAWPFLLGCKDEGDDPPSGEWKALPPHRDEDQVKLDVDRSFIYYPKGLSGQELSVQKEELLDLITEVLRKHPTLCYFQGYHDIVQVFLLVLGRRRATQAAERLSLLRIRDFMLPTMSPALSHLNLLPDILYAANRSLAQRITATQPFFALAATLTLYAHDIQEYADIARLFDFFLASEAVMPIYFYAANILGREKELMAIPDEEPEMLHFTLSKLSQPLDIEALIGSSLRLFARHPPHQLRSWKWVSSDSVLKTTRPPDLASSQTLEYGQEVFDRQAVAVRRRAAIERAVKRAKYTMWMYRRPAVLGAAALAVGVLALWLGNRPLPRHRFW